jgi:hypothetical protein
MAIVVVPAFYGLTLDRVKHGRSIDSDLESGFVVFANGGTLRILAIPKTKRALVGQSSFHS